MNEKHSRLVGGPRERFQKWVLATEHPVYGWLDGHWLRRGDDREGYADPYVQGLWVAFKAFGAAPVEQQGEPVAWEMVALGKDGIGLYRRRLFPSRPGPRDATICWGEGVTSRFQIESRPLYRHAQAPANGYVTRLAYEAMQSEVARLSGRFVLPEHRDSDLRSPVHGYAKGWNACLDEVAKLNGMKP